MDYGKRVRELRTLRKLSANKLGKAADLDQTMIYKIERNEARPSLDALERICTALGVTLTEFFSENKPELLKIATKLKGFPNNGKAQKEVSLQLRNPEILNMVKEEFVPKLRENIIESYGTDNDAILVIDNMNNLSLDDQISFLSELIEKIDFVDNTLIIKPVGNTDSDELVSKIHSLSNKDKKLLFLIIDFFQKNQEQH